MKLCDIHAAIEAGQLLSDDRAFATLVAIEQLAAFEGIPVRTLGLAAPQFAQLYPLHDAATMGMGRPQYQAWRKAILDAQMLFEPGDVDGDPWFSLGRAEILGAGKPNATLYNFWKHLPAGTRPQDVTETLVGEIFRALPQDLAKRYRIGFASFLQLFDNDLARRTGLLPATKPARLPKEHDHFRLVAMAPELRNWRTSLPARGTVNALDYLNRLCLAAGRLNGETDTLEDLRCSLPDLPNPESLGLPPIRAITLRGYETRLLRALGGPNPHMSEAEQAWHDLRSAARKAGCTTSELWAIGKPAASRGILPSNITAADVKDIMRSYKVNSMPAVCRKGCEQFDALRGMVPRSILPLEPLGIRHIPRRTAAPRPKPAEANAAQERAKRGWEDLYAAFRAQGWTHSKVSRNISPLKARCVKAGYAPGDLTLNVFRAIETDTLEANRLLIRNAARHLRALSHDDPRYAVFCQSLPDVPTCRIDGGVPKSCATELEELLNFMNAAASTRRSYRRAVGVFAEALGRPDISLAELLQIDVSDYDLGSHEPQRGVHSGKLRSLREFQELPWTKAWRELQAVVVASGVGAKDNPVPKVLAWRPGTEPNGVTLDWARKLDREFRSTLHNPPHGRADIAKTLARHLAAFDKLHDLPRVETSGLLPPRVGSIR